MFPIVICFLLIFLLSKCTKEGSAGPTGPQGPPGAAGQQGPNGDPGTANVMYSAWDSGFSGTSADWSTPAINAGVLDSSVVLVYVRQNSFVYQVPYDNVNGSGFFINDLLGVGNIFLFCNASYNLNQVGFRYVIIPGGLAIQDVHLSYEHIVNLYNIQP